MKKNTVTLMLLVALGFGGINSANAQNAEESAWITSHYDQKRVKEVQAKFEAREKENYARAMEMASVKGWPLTIERADGYTDILVGLTPNGNPKYIGPKNDGAARTARVTAIRTGGGLFLDLNGQGMKLGIWEPGKVRTSHVDLANKVTVMDGANFDTPNGNNDHATHVSGTMVGAGIGNATYKGLAYQATLLSHDAQNDVSEAYARATNPQTALLVSNHSYGLVPEFVEPFMYGAYTEGSAAWDEVAHEAPYYQSVWAAGNEREGEQRDGLVEEGTAKNTVVVAATYDVTNYTGPSSVQMSTFSTYGPADDRRIKPDIATKGVDVTSASDVSTTAYATLSGTSMASPGVAASLILMQQQYKNLYDGAFMKSATLRGLMIHTADEAGTAPGPDHRFGWGLINVTKAVLLLQSAKDFNTAIVQEKSMGQGDEFVMNVTALGTEPLKVTISWTDLPGAINNGQSNNTTPVLINNLNLKVAKDGTNYLPWKLDSTSSTPAVKGINNVDNKEVVEILQPTIGGVYTITVNHAGNLANFANQDYSFIVSGITDISASVNDSELNGKISVYPNPATDVLNISVDASIDMSAGKVSLYDLQGREVKKFNNFVNQINVSDLSSGIYMLNINRNGSVISKKIIIK